MSQSEFTPTISEATRPYWEATRDRKLLLQVCAACDRMIHHPREACPTCLGQEFNWTESSGKGSVHAMSVHFRPVEAMSPKDCPYVVAFIDLEEGVCFLSNIVDADLDTLKSGDSVELSWTAIGDGYNLPTFAPATR